MDDAEPYLSIEPQARAFALVGRFLHAFALMESKLNDCIGTALHLTDIQQSILCKNIQFRDKTKIVRTLLSISTIPLLAKEKYDKQLLGLGKLSADRNMVAHDLFGADPDGDGVRFFVIKASGSLEFPNTRWSVDDCFEKISSIWAALISLETIRSEFAHLDLVSSILSADPEDLRSMGGLFALGSELLDDRQPLSERDSGAQETTDPNPPKTPQRP